jgi:hypothetical protein
VELPATNEALAPPRDGVAAAEGRSGCLLFGLPGSAIAAAAADILCGKQAWGEERLLRANGN